MNRTALPPLLADLDECIRNLRDAGCDVTGLQRERLALDPPWEAERPSYAPNVGTRRTAHEHFQKTQAYLKEAANYLKGIK